MMDLDTISLASALGNRPFRFYPSVGSTNDIAMTWLREGGPSGGVVVADEQTSGRGRLQRTWQTPPGRAIAMSLLLHPPIQNLPLVMMLGAWGVAATLEQMGIQRVGIKWPNDIQIDGKKVCGILPEIVWEGNNLVGVVLGIGINVDVDFRDTPLAQTATSLSAFLDDIPPRPTIIRDVLAQIDLGYNDLIYAPHKLVDAWRARLNMLGKPLQVMLSTGQIIVGRAVAVDDEGALRLEKPDGSVQRILFGDISNL